MLKILKQYQFRIEKNKTLNNEAFKETLKDFFESMGEDLSLIYLDNQDLLMLKSNGRYLASIETKNYSIELSNLNSKSLNLIRDNSNHIITNYREIDIYKKGKLLCTLSLLDEKGSVSNKTSLIPTTIYTGKSAVDALEKTIKDFKNDPLTCNKPSDLAILLALKTRELKNIIHTCLSAQSSDREKSKLEREFEVYKKLLPDIDISRFSDYYAQTITYGLFIVRYLNAVSNIESSFLEEAFSILSSKKIDDRIADLYQEIESILLQIDLNNISWNYSGDVVIHFYETFLEHYDAKLRKDFGAWYTPDYIVDYQVKSTNALLKYIGYSKGYLDDINILDPATGTSNYLNAILKEAHKEYANNNALWNTVVNSKLINNIHGFEIMMTPFIIAQMRLVETLRASGFEFKENTPPLNLFLTNSLDPPKSTENSDLFQYSDYLFEIDNMSKKVLEIRNKKFACVIGNPPYNAKSTNKSDFILDLMSEYRPNDKTVSLNDDYLKFIRLAQHFIQQNKKGVVSYITNNSFLKNISFDKLRESLLKTFDEIYIINLHGDQKNDDNVFNIMIGVSIYFLVKKTPEPRSTLADLYYYEIIGSKDSKKDFCQNHILNPHTKNGFIKVAFDTQNPSFSFIPKKEDKTSYYDNSFNVADIFKVKCSSISTAKDELYLNTSPSFNIEEKGEVFKYSYRPMDERWIYWCEGIDSKSKRVTSLPKIDGNLFLSFSSSVRDLHDFSHIFISNKFFDAGFFAGKTSGHQAPLYIPIEDSLGLVSESFKHNFKDDYYNKFLSIDPKILPIDIMDYIYGVLNDIEYLKEHNQLLKLNFPRVPYPIDKKQLDHFKKMGTSLREIHTSLTPKTPSNISGVFMDTANKTSVFIDKVSFDKDRVQINDSQYFTASVSIWEFKIGAYRPAKEWLQNRMGQTLSFEQVVEYVNILGVIKETLDITQSKLLLLDSLPNQDNTLF